MASFGMVLPYLAFGLLAASLLWGSILALRGRRWWATGLMVAGSSLQVLGALFSFGGMVWMMTGVWGTMGASGSASASGLASGMAPMLVLVSIGMLSVGLGFLLFAAGFVAFCARSGASERRAAELEGLVEELQRQMNP